MDKKNKKTASLTVRIECKTKENLKEIANKKGLTMSELINNYLTEIVEREILKNKELEKLEKRVAATDEKLLKLKNKLKGENK